MLSGILTSVLLVLFVGLWVWAWQPRLRKGFEATARLAVDDDTIPPGEVRADHEEAGQ
ncbi:cbb3-type cytochrome c oxidase subunit 3 [Thermomonas sp.]|uniref:cbb3-type cytochrome oxidase subunit 3 n=1 Tax=Thermomonas sp. TaxID=1971895 RepID=UPI001DF716BF|nr:cbb3-type cytochrome c oxidase subunit 3 [Thermomonas sp.]MBZ0088406.1 cbb3-type cytochrome c oxidase subunit 3 [Thermomonas sp.]HRO63296.1 cbb3-type cytochrome c oxidase subunit 3 [Thermomonas sp.]